MMWGGNNESDTVTHCNAAQALHRKTTLMHCNTTFMHCNTTFMHCNTATLQHTAMQHRHCTITLH